MKTSRYYWPAEWTEQEAIWFSWPHRSDTWPAEKLSTIQCHFAQIIAIASRYQMVCINADEGLHRGIEKMLAATSASLDSIRLHNHATNDVWCRDHGATFVIDRELQKLCAVDWHFNAWGGKFPPWDLDDAVAKKMSLAVGADHLRSPLFLEGGAIEGNGAGTLITTEAVALNPNRNPEWDKSAIEVELRRCLGVEEVFWLPSGIEGDDTDGHIDDLCRFVKEDALVSVIEKKVTDPNYHVLARNREMLEDLRTVGGSRVEILELPMPEPLVAEKWRLEQLPASYANFVLINGAVLVPTFSQPANDDRALGILRECFGDKEVIGYDCRDLVWEGGALHCISQQQPALNLI